VTGPIEEYLRALRENLRTRPEETSRILAEAEDHLAEAVAAGLAAGLTETEAAEAAVSAFGPVPAVAWAHRTRRGRAAAALTEMGMTIWALAAAVLVSAFALLLIAAVMTGGLTGHHVIRQAFAAGSLAASAAFAALTRRRLHDRRRTQ
jgi:hypothetical protein